MDFEKDIDIEELEEEIQKALPQLVHDSKSYRYYMRANLLVMTALSFLTCWFATVNLFSSLLGFLSFLIVSGFWLHLYNKIKSCEKYHDMFQHVLAGNHYTALSIYERRHGIAQWLQFLRILVYFAFKLKNIKALLRYISIAVRKTGNRTFASRLMRHIDLIVFFIFNIKKVSLVYKYEIYLIKKRIRRYCYNNFLTFKMNPLVSLFARLFVYTVNDRKYLHKMILDMAYGRGQFTDIGPVPKLQRLIAEAYNTGDMR